jgi:5-bromo-4-chloroindolyl phosphate hydrolysis protein
LEDIFNLASVSSDMFSAIKKLSSIHELCKGYISVPSEKKGEKIAETLEEIDKDLEQVKRSIVKMLFMLNSNEKEPE